MMRVIACLLLLYILLTSRGFAESTVWSIDEWFRLTSRYSSVVVLFDSERDGVVETVAIDGYVYIHGSEASSYAYPFKAPLDGSGDLCLLLYNPIRGFINALCPAGFRRITAPLNVLPRVFLHGFIMGDFVYTDGRLYYTPVARTGFLLDLNGVKGVVGIYNETLVLHVLHTGELVELFPIALDVVAAFYSNDTGVLYVAVSVSEDTFILEYNYSSRTLVRYPTPLGIGRAIRGVTTRNSMFVLTESGLLYMVRPGRQPVVVARGDVINYPAENLNSFTLKGPSWVARVIDGERETRVEYVEVPQELGFILSCDWWGSIVAVATNTGVYVATLEEVSVDVSIPTRVFAREAFNISVRGTYETVVVNVSGHVYSAKGPLTATISLASGEHRIQIRACKGLFCRSVERYVFVYPRPLKTVVEYPESAEPYQEISVFIDAVDQLTGKRAVTTCMVEEAAGRVGVFVNPGSNVTIPAIPDVDSAVYTVTCGGGDYTLSTEVVRVKLARLPYSASLKYKGRGLLEVYVYNVFTGEQWTQELVVRLDNETFRGHGYLEITLKPGENRVLIYLVVGDREVFIDEVSVVYFEDVQAVSQMEKEVVVADRVETVTTTFVKPVPIPEPVEVERPDPLVTIASAVLAAGTTYALITLISRARRVEHGE